MRTLDLRSSLFWLLLSVAVIIESLRMDIGTVQSPGMGFMSFWAAGLLAALSLVLLIRTILDKRKLKNDAMVSRGKWRRKVVISLSALVVYALIMPVAGYLISTFILMTFLYWFADPTGLRWFVWSLIFSFLTTTISYYVFSILLNCQFPAGALGI